MITVYCGDNTQDSRNAYSSDIRSRKAKGHTVVSIDSSQVADMVKSGGSDACDLFNGSPIYETINLIPTLKKKYGRKAKDELRALASNSSVQLIDWEDKSAYDLGIEKDAFSFVHDNKLSESTFTLLPVLTPGNRIRFLSKLQLLSQHQPIEMTFSMIIRHTKLMMAISQGMHPRDNPYLVRLAQSSARLWNAKSLTKMYYQLLKIDINTKTGRNTPLNLQQQLEILACMML